MSTPDNPYNRAGFFAFVGSVVFSLCFFVYIAFLHDGVTGINQVEATAGSAEQVVAGETAPANAVDISTIAKPWEDNEAMVAGGAKVYKTACALCHGPAGAGDGPAGKALVPPPRNLVKGDWKVGGTSMALYGTITNGLSGTSMASFKHLKKHERWALVQYIRSITENKEPDDAAKLASFAESAE